MWEAQQMSLVTVNRLVHALDAVVKHRTCVRGLILIQFSVQNFLVLQNKQKKIELSLEIC